MINSKEFKCTRRRRDQVLEKFKNRKGFRIYLYKSDLECDGKEIYGLEVSIWKNGKELEGATFISWPGSGIEPPLYEFYSALEILKKDKVARRWFMNRAWKFIFYDKPMSYYFFPGTYIIDQSKY